MGNKLERKQMKIYGEQADTQDIIAYGSGIESDVIVTKDPDQIQTDQYEKGVRSSVVGKRSPSLQDRMTLDYLFSRALKYLFQRGVAEWLATDEYFIGSVASDGKGGLFVSKTDNNIGNALSNTTHWAAFPTAANLAEKVSKAGDTMTGRLSMGANDILFQNPDGGSLLQIATDGSNWDVRGDATWLRFSPDQFGLTLRDMLGGQDFYNVLDSKTVKDYIVERYSDEEGNWYEVYASGWIRQGGLIPSAEGTITFLKPYTKIPLNVNMQIIQALSGTTGLNANWFNCTTILDRSKTGFNYGSANGADIKRMWFAEGI